MFSVRFNKAVVITQHAQLRMRQRAISVAEMQDVIDHGDTRFKDETHLWVFMDLPGRFDNLVCVVLVLEAVVVVKTVMHYFDLED
jgi:hypothetical protein